LFCSLGIGHGLTPVTLSLFVLEEACVIVTVVAHAGWLG